MLISLSVNKFYKKLFKKLILIFQLKIQYSDKLEEVKTLREELLSLEGVAKVN